MARLLLVALIAYAALDFANFLVPDALPFDDDETVVSKFTDEWHGKIAHAIATPRRRLSMAEPLEAHHRHLPNLAPITQQPPRIHPRRLDTPHPPDASEDH